MIRLFTKNATGVAPDGRWYAGDVNALQDAVAAINDLTQTLGVGTIQLGETGLQFIRYGPGEARITGDVRMDGIVRALGGLYGGSFTTAQRDAIAAGRRPYGLVVLNSTTNRYEWNSGSDAVPNWIPLSPQVFEIPIGMSMEWSWAAGSFPGNTALEYGQALLKATFPTLDAIASAAGYIYGSDATHFNLPDKRGRVSAGKDDMGGTAANRITAAISGTAGTVLGAVIGNEGVSLTTGQMPAHNHGLSGTLSFSDPTHIHGTNDGVTGAGAGSADSLMGSGSGNNTTPSATGITIGLGSLATTNTGSGSAHLNVQPTVIVNRFMRLA